MPHSHPPQPTPRRLSRAYLRQNRFEFMLGALALAAGAAFFADPNARARAAVGALAGPLDEMWSASYGIGGLLICLGLALRWHGAIRLEAAGLWLLSSALAVNLVAVFNYRGLAGIGAAGPFVVCLWAALGKLIDIHRAAQQIEGHHR